MISPESLYLLRVAYFMAFVGTVAFLVTWEGGDSGFGLPARRWRHLTRNFALFLLAVLLADGVVGFGLLHLGDRLNLQPSGLLTPLGLPLWALIVAGLLVADFVAYAFHRLCHRWRWLWLFHAVHHSDPHLDVSSTVREHPLELVCDVALMAGTLLALGIPLWVEGVRAILVNPQAMLQHANLRYPPWVERSFAALWVTPAMHRVHHAPTPTQTNSNYGVMFSFWDRIFGTYYAPDPAAPPHVGLDRLQDERWHTMSGMLLTPIRARGIGTL